MTDAEAIAILERDKALAERTQPNHPASQDIWRERIYAANLAISALLERIAKDRNKQ